MEKTYRTILSSGRDVPTIEEETIFWVKHYGPCIHGTQLASGPFPLNEASVETSLFWRTP